MHREADVKQRQAAELFVAIVSGVETLERFKNEGIDLRLPSPKEVFSDDREQYPGFKEARNKWLQQWSSTFNAVGQLEDSPIKTQAIDALLSQFGLKRPEASPKDSIDQ